LISIRTGFWTTFGVGAIGGRGQKSDVGVGAFLNQEVGVDVFVTPWKVAFIAWFSTILIAAIYHSSGLSSSGQPIGSCAIKS